ncbi:MAG: hypothetical protein L3J10_08490 [Sulfurimonas sp.]|nr:hypothetical protein [Sulfurimonas sp.]
MAYIAGLVIVGLFFLALHYFTETTRKQKILVTSVVLAVIMAAIAFNAHSTSQREKMMNVVMKFNQHKTILCGNIEVNDKDYTLSIGTYTFIGIENTPSYGQMISASTCE